MKRSILGAIGVFLFVFTFALTFSSAGQPTQAAPCPVCDCVSWCPSYPIHRYFGYASGGECIPGCRPEQGLPCSNACPEYDDPGY